MNRNTKIASSIPNTRLILLSNIKIKLTKDRNSSNIKRLGINLIENALSDVHSPL